MQTLLVLAVCFAFATAGSLPFDSSDHLNEQWQLFKTKYKRTYETELEEKLRRSIFEENLRYIQRHNYEADLGRHSYRLGINQFADLTNAEYRRLLLGLRHDASHSSSGAATFLAPTNVQLPDSVDWRTKGYVTPVKNQQATICQACWAFSTTGSLEGQHFKKTGRLISLSEQNLIDCSRSFGTNGCYGGYADNAFKYIIYNEGINSEASYPYMAKEGICRFDKNHVAANATGFVLLATRNETALKSASATVGPISVGIDATGNFRYYKSGVYNNPNCSSKIYNLDHAVLVVGYGSENGNDYWLVKNSYGAYWGESGYIKMSRNKNNQCGIATYAIYPLV